MNTHECKICNLFFNRSVGLANHLRFKHGTSIHQYYDAHYKNKENSTCKTCGKETKWLKDKCHYQTYCNSACFGADEEQLKKREQTHFKKYGTTNINALPEKIEKSKQTCLEKYGNVCSVQSKDIHKKAEQTWMNKYGVDHFAKAKEVRNKIKNTLKSNYGVITPFDSPEIRQRSMNTMQQRYGVSYAMQNLQSHKLNQKNCYRSKQYILPSGVIINIRGFEPQFLDYVFINKLLGEDEVDYSPKAIKYTNRVGTVAYYYPDFLIPKLNLIVEIKSRYTVKLDKNIEQKREACIQHGYGYIRIVDNNFEEFHQLVALT